MTNFERLVLTLGIVFVSLCIGYLFKIQCGRGRLPFSENALVELRKRLQSCAIFALLPFSAMLSLWGLPRPESSLLTLPLLGLASYIWGGTLAIVFARFLKMDRLQTGSLYCCGTFTNIGAVGGLVCLLFLGENSIALVAFYRLLEEVFFFSISFPIARWYGAKNATATLSFRDFKLNPVLCVIVFALSLGIILNLCGVPRPAWGGWVASGAMLTATMFFLFAIGMSLKITSLFNYKRACAVVCFIKFLGVPLVITALAWGMGYASQYDGLALKTVAILSSMPVAMTALVPPSLFDLDLDLANACWIVSTICLVAILPALMFILPML